MNPVRKSLALAGAGLLAACLASTSDAQNLTRPRSSLNITEPTEVPGGVVLQPGNYMIQVSDNQSSWNVIKITDPSEQKTFATILATPHTAKDSAQNSMFVYFNTPAGQPKVLRSWWPPNDRWGQDFIYPKERAAQLTQGTSETVPEETAEMREYESSHRADTSATPTDTTAQNDTSRTSTFSTNDSTDTTAHSSDAGSTWRSDTGTTAQNTTTATPETTTASNDTTTRNTTLPRTASPFPLLALAGAASLGLGLAVRRYAA